jgi:hypothetical protein
MIQMDHACIVWEQIQIRKEETTGTTQAMIMEGRRRRRPTEREQMLDIFRLLQAPGLP